MAYNFTFKRCLLSVTSFTLTIVKSWRLENEREAEHAANTSMQHHHFRPIVSPSRTKKQSLSSPHFSSSAQRAAHLDYTLGFLFSFFFRLCYCILPMYTCGGIREVIQHILGERKKKACTYVHVEVCASIEQRERARRRCRRRQQEAYTLPLLFCALSECAFWAAASSRSHRVNAGQWITSAKPRRWREVCSRIFSRRVRVLELHCAYTGENNVRWRGTRKYVVFYWWTLMEWETKYEFVV